MNSKITPEEYAKYIEIDNKIDDIKCDLADLIDNEYYRIEAAPLKDSIDFRIYHDDDGTTILWLRATIEDIGKDYPHRDLFEKYKLELQKKEDAEKARLMKTQRDLDLTEFNRLKAKLGL